MYKIISNIYIIIAAIMMVACLGSCTDGFEEMNNPNFQPSTNKIKKPEKIEGDPGDYIYNFTYQGVIDNHQRTTNLYHDLYAHYFANNKFEASNHYLYRDDWMKFRWEQFYTNRFQEFKEINKICVQDTVKIFKNAYNIAWINFYFLSSLMTDTYGPIPFTSVIENMTKELETGKEDKNPNMFFDSQEKIYDKLFKGLDKTQKNLDLSANSDIYKYDERENVYNGDVLKWKKFANSLRLRLAMRIVNIDPIRAKQEGEKAIAAGIMDSNNDTYALHYSWGNGGHENDYALVGFLWGDVVMSKDLENMYKQQSANLDPRCPKCWFKNLTPFGDVQKGIECPLPFAGYVGNWNGAENVQHHDDKYSYLKSLMGERNTNFWFDYNRPMEAFNYAEVCFLMAEASLRGWAGASETPKEYYLKGIRASMDYFEIPKAVADKYINELKNDPFDSGDKEAILEQIINQKWLANFPNGAEGWADFRRTDYPALTPIISNRSSDVPQGKFIKRINYPVSVHDLNEDNVPDKYKYATDSKGSRLWWDVEDTQITKTERNKPNNFR